MAQPDRVLPGRYARTKIRPAEKCSSRPASFFRLTHEPGQVAVRGR